MLPVAAHSSNVLKHLHANLNDI